MSLIVFVLVAFAFAGRRRSASGRAGAVVNVVGLVGLVATVVAAIAIQPGQIVVDRGRRPGHDRLPAALPGPRLAGRARPGGRRACAGGTRRDAPAVTLAILAAGALTLGLADPRAAVLVATAGGSSACWYAAAVGGRAGATVGIRETRAVVVAGTLAIAATAWFGRDLSQLAAQPVVFGLAYLAFAVAVAMRFGAIPFHLWAARLTDAVPETALPILTALAPAALAIVALAWTDASVAPLLVDLWPFRLIVLAIAIASIVLAAVAAFVQDDLEHIVGYSIVGDAGVVMLALAALDPAAWAPARTWILVFVVARGALRRVGRRDPDGVLDRTGGRPARLGPALAAPRGRASSWSPSAAIGCPGRRLRCTGGAGRAGARSSRWPRSSCVGDARAPGLLRAAARHRPDAARTAAGEPIDAWRPRLTRPDVTAIRALAAGGRGTPTAPSRRSRSRSLLAVLALATSGGAFDGPVAAAGLPTEPRAARARSWPPVASGDLPCRSSRSSP